MRLNDQVTKIPTELKLEKVVMQIVKRELGLTCGGIVFYHCEQCDVKWPSLEDPNRAET